MDISKLDNHIKSKEKKNKKIIKILRRVESNHRPLGYEPIATTNYATSH